MKLSARVLFSIGKFLCLFLTLTYILLSTSPVAYAQGNDVRSYTSYEPNTNSDVPQNQHTLVQTVTIELMVAGLCQLTGIDILNPQKGCLGIDSNTNKIGYAPQSPGGSPQLGGVLGTLAYSTGTLYTPAASGVEYTRNLAQNFGIVKSATAQGPAPTTSGEYTGETALQPVRYVWTTARNITYMGFVFVFIVLGVAIMLRVKIDPRTVMTIQNQIPRIVVALLLITFSYALVGFMIDLMWTTTYFVINTLSPAITITGESNGELVQSQATANLYNNPLHYFNDLYFDPANNSFNKNIYVDLAKDIGATIGDVVGKIIFSIFGINAANLGCDLNINFNIFPPSINPTNSVGDCIGAALYEVTSIIVGILGALIIAIALISAMIRIWFMLIKAYVYVIFYTILAPFYIFLGLLPGSSLGFSNWVRAVASNLVVFPAAVGMFLLARFFAISNSPYNVQNDINTQYNPFVPPLVGNPALLNGIGLFIAFGIIMLIPELLQMIRDALKTSPNKYAAPAIQGGFSAGSAVVGGISGGVLGKMMHFDPSKGHVGTIPAIGLSVLGRYNHNLAARIGGGFAGNRLTQLRRDGIVQTPVGHGHTGGGTTGGTGRGRTP